jgi:hypothetical protein
LSKVFDIFVSLLVIVFFAGYLNIHSGLLGLEQSPIPVGKQVKELWEWLTWAVFAILGVDLYLKYRKVRDPREFVRKHWLDILMIAFLPLFAGFKIAKIAIKAVKGAKLAKSGIKAFLGAKKLQKAGVGKK